MDNSFLTGKKKNPSKFVVTNNVISYRGQSWSVSNITTLRKYKITKKRKNAFSSYSKVLLILIIAIVTLEYFIPVSYYIIGFTCLRFFYMFWQDFIKKPIYGLKLVSAAGESELFTSPDEKFVDLLVNTITRVIDSKKDSDLTVNIDNKTIYDNISKSIIGSTVSTGPGSIGF